MSLLGARYSVRHRPELMLSYSGSEVHEIVGLIVLAPVGNQVDVVKLSSDKRRRTTGEASMVKGAHRYV